MLDLMADIESLGNIPGCVLCQYTLVPFNINGRPYEGPLQPLNIILHIGEQIAEGFDVDTDTLAWWMKSPIEVRRTVFTGDTDMYHFCTGLEGYLKTVVEQHKDYRIWSTSAKVDFGIPPVLFKRLDFPYPVYHRAERCARTFIEAIKLKYPKLKLSKLVTTHNAVDDCKRQIDDLQIAYKQFMGEDTQSETSADEALTL